MDKAKLSILLCDDMEEFSSDFEEQQKKYFDVDVCQDIHELCSRLRILDKKDKLPDVLLLDLFAKRANILEDDNFYTKRREVDADVKDICAMLQSTGEKAREVLYPHGIDYLKIIRNEYPEYKLPILLYSRLGPYILHPEEAAAVDKYNSEFLLKWLDPDEQRKKIERFFSKWRSQDQPTALEIARKLSTLPAPLAAAVAELLKSGNFEDAIRRGFLELTDFLQKTFGCKYDGKRLSRHMKVQLLERYQYHKEEHFKERIEATCWLYHNIYVLRRSPVSHRLRGEAWREVDMCLSSCNLIWREIEELISNSA